AGQRAGLALIGAGAAGAGAGEAARVVGHAAAGIGGVARLALRLVDLPVAVVVEAVARDFRGGGDRARAHQAGRRGTHGVVAMRGAGAADAQAGKAAHPVRRAAGGVVGVAVGGRDVV